MSFAENIRLALRSIRSNLLRAILTLLIIATGIMALVGILTAIDSAMYSLQSNFSRLGASTFTIEPAGRDFGRRHGGKREKQGDPISYDQTQEFKERFSFPASICVDFRCTGSAEVSYKDKETNPNVSVRAVDANYISVKGYDIEAGRNFTEIEAENNNNRAIIGKDLVEQLFDNNAQSALEQSISVGNLRFKVIGVLGEKGTSSGGSNDRTVLIPLFVGKRFFGSVKTNYNLNVAATSSLDIDAGVDVATGLFRSIRGLRLSEEDDFVIKKDDSLVEMIRDNTTYLRSAAVGIGIITLLGAAIGLMNIMLVSVTERTREIGVRKAIGASSSIILKQFLVEAVVICQIGGIVGVILGILIGNLVTILLGGSFLIPWNWMILSLIVCTLVGLFAGLYPAVKAASLDPIEALRYE